MALVCFRIGVLWHWFASTKKGFESGLFSLKTFLRLVSSFSQ